MSNLTKNHTEMNPFGSKTLFKFNPRSLKWKNSCNINYENKPSGKMNNLKKIKENAPYKHSSDKSIPMYKGNVAKSIEEDESDFTLTDKESLLE